ncbi:hypothetical protein F4780DRAFT_394467 [Xylariomycetidae sp. FL0641]|nr:hypothetical protein F4780DRAFT_394467 [Xylariomycetidae sp. FL0641]
MAVLLVLAVWLALAVAAAHDAAATPAFRAGASPQATAGLLARTPQDDDNPPTTPVTVTVTVTVTPSVEILTVSSTLTRSLWTTTTTLDAVLNCTAQIYAAPPPPPRDPVAAQPTSSPAIERRRWASDPEQLSSWTVPPPPLDPRTQHIAHATTTTTALAEEAAADPPILLTHTVWEVATETRREPATRTRYACRDTVAWWYTYAATTTVRYVRTAWAATATRTSTISCRGISGVRATAVAGDAAVEGPRASVPTEQRRTTDAANQEPEPAPAPTITGDDGTTVTSTVNLTATAYTRVTTTRPATTTSLRVACAQPSYDITVAVPVTRTVWASTVVETSYKSCVPPPFPTFPPPPTRGVVAAGWNGTTGKGEAEEGEEGGEMRMTTDAETSTTTTSTSTHSSRTFYILTMLTQTETVPSTHTVVRCSATESEVGTGTGTEGAPEATGEVS